MRSFKHDKIYRNGFMDIIKETQNGIEALHVVGLSMRKHKKQLEFLPILGSTALTHLDQISNKYEILRMISNDNYYLDDLLEERSLYLPGMNICEIYNICGSINKLELYKCRCGELLTQLYIETLSIHPDLNKLEYIRHGLEMCTSGQIDNELIRKHYNQLIQMSMISVESEANSSIRDKCIDLVISDTIGKLVINHGNDMFFSNCGILRTQLVHSLLKHFVRKEFYNTSAINEKMWFLNSLSSIMKYSSNCNTLGCNYQLRLLDNNLFNILDRQEDGQGNQVEINPLHIACIANLIAQCVNCNHWLTQSNLFDIGSAGSEKEDEEQGNDETIFSFFENVQEDAISDLSLKKSVKFAFDTMQCLTSFVTSDVDSKMKERCFSLLTHYCDAGTSLNESNFDNDNGEVSLTFGEINRLIDILDVCVRQCYGYSNSDSTLQLTSSILNDEKFLTFHTNLWKCLEAILEVCFFSCLLYFLIFCFVCCLFCTVLFLFVFCVFCLKFQETS